MMRALLSPALDDLRQHGGLDGKLPEGLLGFLMPIPLRFTDGVEVVVRCSRVKAKGNLPMVRIQIGEGKGATTRKMGAEGHEIAHVLSSLLAAHHRRVAAKPQEPTLAERALALHAIEQQARRINATYGGKPGRGAEVTALGVEVMDGGLHLRLRAHVDPTQAHVMLAAARLCGLLDGKSKKAGQAAETMANATSTLVTALAAVGHGAETP
jgi:hypothetical protein